MPKLTVAVPKYRKHRASGQAIVTVNGRDHYLGPHKSKASKLEYDRLVNQWLVTNRDPRFGLPVHQNAALTVAELINKYRFHCEKHYRNADGTPTGSIETIKAIMKRLRERYGDYAADEFKPLAFKEFIKSVIADDCSRTYVNMVISKVKQMFRWGVSEELVESQTFERLDSVRGEQAGRSEARETGPVPPVADNIVDATTPHLPEMVQAMVKLQRLTGMRPGEVCSMKCSELTELDGVIIYTPGHHKTKHKGKRRLIVLGPKARLALAPYLGTGDEFVFSPKRSVSIEMVKRGIKRTPPKTAGDHYTNDSYRRAIHRACEEQYGKEDKTHWWAPNQLRHALATEVREVEKSFESVAAVLGHANINTSEVYAERNMKLAIEVMRKIG